MLSKLLGTLTLEVTYPTESGALARRGIRMLLGSAPMDRYAGERRAVVLQIPFETLGSVLGTPVRVRVDDEHSTVVIEADPPVITLVDPSIELFAEMPSQTDQVDRRLEPRTVPPDQQTTGPGFFVAPGMEMGVTPGMLEKMHTFRAPVQRGGEYELARAGYDAYVKKAGGKSLVSGEALPEWDALKPEVKEAWASAALAVVTAH